MTRAIGNNGDLRDRSPRAHNLLDTDTSSHPRTLRQHYLDRLGGMGGRPTEPVRTYPQGRVCRELGYDTRLSIYNGDIYCAQHQPRRA